MKKVMAMVLVVLICLGLGGCHQKTLKEAWQDQIDSLDQEKVKKLGEGLIDYHLDVY